MHLLTVNAWRSDVTGGELQQKELVQAPGAGYSGLPGCLSPGEPSKTPQWLWGTTQGQHSVGSEPSEELLNSSSLKIKFTLVVCIDVDSLPEWCR